MHKRSAGNQYKFHLAYGTNVLVTNFAAEAEFEHHQQQRLRLECHFLLYGLRRMNHGRDITEIDA